MTGFDVLFLVLLALGVWLVPDWAKRNEDKDEP